MDGPPILQRNWWRRKSPDLVGDEGPGPAAGIPRRPRFWSKGEEDRSAGCRCATPAQWNPTTLPIDKSAYEERAKQNSEVIARRRKGRQHLPLPDTSMCRPKRRPSGTEEEE